MISLRDLQRDFLACLLDDGAIDAKPWVTTNGLSSDQRLQIYRNNAVINFEKALKATFPVVCRLAGDDWFAQSSRAYQRVSPSDSGDLNQIGRQFAAFLAVELRATDYEYFVDVARLEWAYHECLTEREAEPGNLSGLSAVPAQQLHGLRFRVNPTARAIASTYPLFDIWKTHQRVHHADLPPIDLRQGRSDVFLIRRSDHVEIRELPASTLRLFEALSAGATVSNAFESVANTHLAFEPATALGRLIQLQALIGFQLDPLD